MFIPRTNRTSEIERKKTMAVSGRRNGLMEEDDHDDDNLLFEENGIEMDFEADTPPHLRRPARDLNALRC